MSEVGEHALEQVLEVGALGRGPGALGATCGGRRLDRDQPLLEPLEAGRDLLAELVHRRVEPGRVEQQGELGRVPVEVALEHPADPPDRAVALGLVEQLLDHRAQGAPIAEELLERPRQAAVAIGEVRPEGLLERLGGLLVDRFGLADELLELGPDDVDVDRDARILEREQADPDRPLDQVGAIVHRSLAQERREGRIADHEALDHDPLALEPDPGGRESAPVSALTTVRGGRAAASMPRTVDAGP